MNPPANSKTFTAVAGVTGAVVGILAGCLGMFWTTADRIEKQIETRVTKELSVESRLSWLEAKTKSLENELNQQRQTTRASNSQ